MGNNFLAGKLQCWQNQQAENEIYAGYSVNKIVKLNDGKIILGKDKRFFLEGNFYGRYKFGRLNVGKGSKFAE